MTRFVFILVAVAIAWAPTARADDPSAQAQVLFQEGRDLMAAGKFAEACAVLEESQKRGPAISTLLNLAGCREKNGQLATAWGLFLEAERQTRSATDDATRQYHDIAENFAKKLEPRVSTLAINVPQNHQFEGLEISRGTERVEAVMWNRVLPMDGGTYTIIARAHGVRAWSTDVMVGSEGDRKTVDVPDLRKLGPPKTNTLPLVPVIAVKRHDAPAPHDRSKVVPLALGAGSVALLGGALGFELLGRSTYDKAQEETTDQARRDLLYRSANTKRYAAEGLGVAGVGCVGVAIWLYLRSEKDEVARTTVVPTAGTDHAGVAVMGRF